MVPMDRLTTTDGTLDVAADPAAAWARLAAYEDVWAELTSSLVAIPAELATLKAAGREKTLRYRELVGAKLWLAETAALFARHGITP